MIVLLIHTAYFELIASSIITLLSSIFSGKSELKKSEYCCANNLNSLCSNEPNKIVSFSCLFK